jgi:hypothetical protein
MGLFKKTLGALNRNYDVADELIVRLSPSIRRVNKLDQRGTPANGVITGIRFSLNDTTTRKEYAVAVQRGDEWQRIGVRTQPNEAHRLRLGVPVVVKVDGDRGILDWEAMRDAWGLGGQFLSQESMRSAPDDGIIDTALDMRVQSHLKKWTPTEATIVSLRRRTVMGMATLNWDIELDLPDGGRTLSKGDEVPSYAQWYAAPGAVVPAVVNPKDAGAASIDWPAFALAQFDQAGFDDDPPEGSIAAEVESGRDAGATQTTQAGGRRDAEVSSDGPVTLDATMQGWVDALRAGYMKRKDFDKALADWQAAGMCTPAQVDAARTEAG